MPLSLRKLWYAGSVTKKREKQYVPVYPSLLDLRILSMQLSSQLVSGDVIISDQELSKLFSLLLATKKSEILCWHASGFGQ